MINSVVVLERSSQILLRLFQRESPPPSPPRNIDFLLVIGPILTIEVTFKILIFKKKYIFIEIIKIK